MDRFHNLSRIGAQIAVKMHRKPGASQGKRLEQHSNLQPGTIMLRPRQPMIPLFDQKASMPR